MDNLAISVRRATPEDAVALSELVNRAFLVERAFVDGDRTDPDEIAELTRRGVFLVLEHANGLAAAICLEPRGTGAYIGMLSVDPELQGMGLGTRLVRIAEALAEAQGITQLTLRIVNLREELVRWYRRLGYRPVGTSPFPDAGVKQPCHFIEMHKRLGAESGAEWGAAAGLA